MPNQQQFTKEHLRTQVLGTLSIDAPDGDWRASVTPIDGTWTIQVFGKSQYGKPILRTHALKLEPQRTFAIRAGQFASSVIADALAQYDADP